MDRSRAAVSFALSGLLLVTGLSVKWLAPTEEQFDIVAVVDVSFSMAADDDVESSRIDTVRAIIKQQLLPRIAGGSRVGLVTFCGGSYEIMPLSKRQQVASEFTDDVKIGFAPGNGSCFKPGLLRACEMLKREGRKDVRGRIVLFTHGEPSDPEELEDAVEACRESKAEVVIVGVGSSSERTIPMCRLPRDAQVIFPRQPVVSRYDNPTARQFDSPTKVMTAREDEFLQELARRLNGRCVLINSRSDFDKVNR